MRILSLAVMLQALAAGAEELELPVFTDVTQESGIRVKHSFGDFHLDNIVEATGAGAMFFDYDGDGWLDAYFPNGCWLKEVSDNRGRSLRDKLADSLWRSNGDGTFTDVTERAGLGDKGFSFGSSAADFDSDGDLDLYVLQYGPNVFYRNNGDGTFTNVSRQSGLANPRWSLAAPWFDYDNDGDLDVYVVNYLEYDRGKFRAVFPGRVFPGPLAYSGQPDTLYRNNGDGTFTDVTREAGLYNPEGRGMSATVGDLDNDGFLDLYVANDAMGNYYYENTGRGTFEDKGLLMGLEFGEGGQGVSSMGPALGDVDRNGMLDVYVPDMRYGCLLLNYGHYFEDCTAKTSLAVVCGQYTGWGGVLLDYDNDGYLDLFVANGHAHREFTEEDVLMRNNGETFDDVADRSGPYFRQKYVGRGAAGGDYDNDGDLDLLVANLNDSPRLLRNDGGNKNHWLTIAAKLPGGKVDAIGARVTVKTGSLAQVADLVPVTGYLSQADPRVHFGLGKATAADSVEIRWPDGSITQLENVRAGQILPIVQQVKSAE
ncbi:MAG: CRTAC1 family protein [Planctomycetota bacterium]